MVGAGHRGASVAGVTGALVREPLEQPAHLRLGGIDGFGDVGVGARHAPGRRHELAHWRDAVDLVLGKVQCALHLLQLVADPLVGVPQDLVGARDFLEALLGLGVVGDVGMQALREAAVSGFDLVRSSRALDAEE